MTQIGGIRGIALRARYATIKSPSSFLYCQNFHFFSRNAGSFSRSGSDSASSDKKISTHRHNGHDNTRVFNSARKSDAEGKISTRFNYKNKHRYENQPRALEPTHLADPPAHRSKKGKSRTSNVKRWDVPPSDIPLLPPRSWHLPSLAPSPPLIISPSLTPIPTPSPSPSPSSISTSKSILTPTSIPPLPSPLPLSTSLAAASASSTLYATATPIPLNGKLPSPSPSASPSPSPSPSAPSAVPLSVAAPSEPVISNRSLATAPWGLDLPPLANGDIVEFVDHKYSCLAIIVDCTGTYNDPRLTVAKVMQKNLLRITPQSIMFRLPVAYWRAMPSVAALFKAPRSSPQTPSFADPKPNAAASSSLAFSSLVASTSIPLSPVPSSSSTPVVDEALESFLDMLKQYGILHESAKLARSVPLPLPSLSSTAPSSSSLTTPSSSPAPASSLTTPSSSPAPASSSTTLSSLASSASASSSSSSLSISSTTPSTSASAPSASSPPESNPYRKLGEIFLRISSAVQSVTLRGERNLDGKDAIETNEYFTAKNRREITALDMAKYLFPQYTDAKTNLPWLIYVLAAQRFLTTFSLYFAPKSAGRFKCRSPMKSTLRKNLYRSLQQTNEVEDFILAVRGVVYTNMMSKMPTLSNTLQSIIQTSALATPPPPVSRVESAINEHAVRKPDRFVAWNPARFASFITLLKQHTFMNQYELEDKRIVAQLINPLRDITSKDSLDMYNLLLVLGVVDKHENIHWLKALSEGDFVPEFPRKIQDSAGVLLTEFNTKKSELSSAIRSSEEKTRFDSTPIVSIDSVSSEFKGRADFRKMHVFAVDSSDTVEIDDGVSIDREGWIHVHIADPSRVIAPNTLLDLSARARGSTVYLPERKSGMFPMELSTRVFSIAKASASASAGDAADVHDEMDWCFAMTFSARLNDDGSIQESIIRPSVLGAVDRLTYGQVDAILLDDSSSAQIDPIDPLKRRAIHRIFSLAARRKAFRERSGALFIHMPRPEIKIGSDNNVTITLQRAEEKSQVFVSEMMILAGEIAANYAHRHDQVAPTLPVPFVSFLSSLPPLLRDHNMLSAMSAGVTTTSPASHFGVGLPVYLRTTSPIRRYTDLIAHYQLKAHLSAAPLPFPASQLETVLQVLERRMQYIKELTRASEKFWISKYFQQQNPDRAYPAIILSFDEKQKLSNGTFKREAYVLLSELGVKGKLKLMSQENVSLGQDVLVRCHRVDHMAVHFILSPTSPLAVAAAAAAAERSK